MVRRLDKKLKHFAHLSPFQAITLTSSTAFLYEINSGFVSEIIRCSVPPVNSLQQTVLTCFFPEDLSVSKKDFTVYHYVQFGSPGE